MALPSTTINYTRKSLAICASLSVGTTLLLLLIVDIAANLYFGTSAEMDTCPARSYRVSASVGLRALPNSDCEQRVFESAITRYHFNECGFRSDSSCGPKRPGTFRIALIGSSFSEGMLVENSKTYAFLLPRLLQDATGRRFDLQNLALPEGTPAATRLRMGSALDLKPDLLLYIVTEWDIQNVDVIYTPYNVKPPRSALVQQLKHSLDGTWLKAEIQKSRAFMRHLILLSPTLTANQFLQNNEDEGLQVKSSVRWQSKLDSLNHILGQMARQTGAAGIPFVVSFLPSRVNTILMTFPSLPEGVDPAKIGKDVEAISRKNGATYVDLQSGLSRIPERQYFYYPLNGHINDNGDAAVAKLLCDGLLSKSAIGQEVHTPVQLERQ